MKTYETTKYGKYDILYSIIFEDFSKIANSHECLHSFMFANFCCLKYNIEEQHKSSLFFFVNIFYFTIGSAD